ncbi:hypothetical protein BLX90_13240 [Rhizobium sp. Y9]|nr:hypothetical protein BLX90_13240 [Rhizobium sp. Y9]
MFKICLFDLDDTLIRTDDLKLVREACKNNDEAKNLSNVMSAIKADEDRHLYELAVLQKIRSDFPDLKLGVFTRSPGSYAKVVLDWAYPKFSWDIVVAYEDVKWTKPRGDGIVKAIREFGVKYLTEVILVGDNDVDVRSAYNCGCPVVVDKGGWPYKWGAEHWGAVQRVPDAFIDSPSELPNVLSDSHSFLPDLERLIEGASGKPRFDKINHFIPRAVGGDTTAYPIHVAGRYFANYKSIQQRRKWHALTDSIEKNKNSDAFPEEWIKTIRNFISEEFPAFFGTTNVVVTVIPHRPGRKPRLENLLTQLQASIAEEPIKKRAIVLEPDLFAYKDGVKSQHNDHLNGNERFENVRDHLMVQKPQSVSGAASYLILDDVTTTGASLIYASKYLKAAGANVVKCLSLAKNIGTVL